MTKYVNNIKCFARLWALRAIPSVKISNVCKPHTYLVALNWAYSKKHRVTEGKWHERLTSRLEGGVPYLEKDLAEEQKKGINLKAEKSAEKSSSMSRGHYLRTQ